MTSSFSYGADGLRRSATAGGVTTHYVLDGQNVVQEVTGTNRVTTLWGPRGPEARIAPDGTALWYVYDGHGNVLGEVDANGVLNPDSSGNPTAARVFDPWGYVLNWQQVADNGNPLKYCGSLGHPSENATGLIYMRARYYDPGLGRFISEDPARDGGNWFAYAGNDPVGMVDPDGRFVLGDLLTGADVEARQKLQELLSAQGAKSWVEHKLVNTMWKWAEQFSVNVADEAALSFGTESMQIVGSTINGRGYHILLHAAGHAREAPHIQFVLDHAGTMAKVFF